MVDDAKTAVTVDGAGRAASNVARSPVRLPPRFRFLRELGEGGMGTVVAARDRVLDREVAVKVLGDESRPSARERFAREARAAAALDHPNIVTVYDVDELGGIIVMELADGGSLADRLTDDEPLDESFGRELATQLLSAIEAAHEAGIVHRDIKPANILLTSSGTIKLADFGIACIGGSELTQTGTQVGTPLYMAPEQLRGGEAGVTADIYAAGATLFEATTRERLNNREGPHPDPRGALLAATKDRAFVEAILRATATRAADRFQSTAEFRDAINTPQRRRGSRWLIATGLVLAAAAALAATLILRDSSPQPEIAAEPRAKRPTVAMLPFEGGESLYVGGALGLSELLGLQLAQTGHVEVIPVRRLVNRTGPDGALEAWRSAARTLDADYTIRGSIEVSKAGGKLLITIEDADGAPVSSIPRTAEPGSSTEQVRYAAREVLRAIRGDIEIPEKTHSDIPDGVWANLSRGIDLLWGHEHGEAVHYLRAAVDAAPELGLARYYLSITLWWNARPDAEVLAEIDAALASGLSGPQMMTLEGLRLLVEHRYKESIATFRRLVEEQPEDIAGLYGLFEALFHGGYPREAIARYERLWELNPRFMLGFQHAIGYYAAHGLTVRLQRELSRTGSYEDPEMTSWVVQGLFAAKRYDEVLKVATALERRPTAGAGDRAAKALTQILVVPALLVSGKLEQAIAEDKRRSDIGIESALASLGLAIARDRPREQRAARAAVREHLRTAVPATRTVGLISLSMTLLLVADNDELAALAEEIEAAAPPERLGSRNIQVPLAILAGHLGNQPRLETLARSEFPEVRAIAEAHLAKLSGELEKARTEARAAIDSASDGVFMIAEHALLAQIARALGDRALLEATCAEIVEPRVFSWTWVGAVRTCKAWLAEPRTP